MRCIRAYGLICVQLRTFGQEELSLKRRRMVISEDAETSKAELQFTIYFHSMNSQLPLQHPSSETGCQTKAAAQSWHQQTHGQEQMRPM